MADITETAHAPLKCSTDKNDILKFVRQCLKEFEKIPEDERGAYVVVLAYSGRQCTKRTREGTGKNVLVWERSGKLGDESTVPSGQLPEWLSFTIVRRAE